MRAGVSAVLVATLVTNLVPSAHAQPTAPAQTESPAKQLFKAAEQAMAEGRHADAITDYTKAFELSKEVAFLYKLGRAHQLAGDCKTAIDFYGRYLREGKPEQKFVDVTRQRIVECGGDPDKAALPPEPVKPPEPTEPTKPPEVVVETKPAPAEAPPPPPPPPPKGKHQTAWLLVGGSLAMFTIGGVLAYSANAAENDVLDLYQGFDGNPPRFSEDTTERYDALIEEGERYQLLSRVSLGVAAGLGIGAAIVFWRGRGTADEPARVAPVVSPRNTGIVVRF